MYDSNCQGQEMLDSDQQTQAVINSGIANPTVPDRQKSSTFLIFFKFSSTFLEFSMHFDLIMAVKLGHSLIQESPGYAIVKQVWIKTPNANESD